MEMKAQPTQSGPPDETLLERAVRRQLARLCGGEEPRSANDAAAGRETVPVHDGPNRR